MQSSYRKISLPVPIVGRNMLSADGSRRLRGRLLVMALILATALPACRGGEVSGIPSPGGDAYKVPCQPDESRCERDALFTCAADGSEWTARPCPGGCASRATPPMCHPVNCVADSVTCLEGVLLQCRADGKGHDVVQRCADGCTLAKDGCRSILVATAGGPQTIMAGASATLTAKITGGDPPYACSWSLLGDGVVGAGCNLAVAPLETSEYTLKVIDATGATATDKVTVSVYGALSVTVADDQTVVVGQPAKLKVTVSGGYGTIVCSWTTSGTVVDNSCDLLVVADAPGEVRYTATVTDGLGNTTSADVTLTAVEKLSVNAGKEIHTDVDTPVLLDATTSGGAVPQCRWTISGGDATPFSSDCRTKVSPQVTTTYTVTASDKTGQVVSDQLTVHVLRVEASADLTAVVAGDSVILTAITSGNKGTPSCHWKGSNGTERDGCVTSATPTISETFTLTAKDGETGLLATAVLAVTVYPKLEIGVAETLIVAAYEKVAITATVNGGIPPISCSWEAISDGVAVPVGGKSCALDFSPTVPGELTYRVTAEDGQGHTISAKISLIVYDSPLGVAPGGPYVIAPGAKLTLQANATGGYKALTCVWSSDQSDLSEQGCTREVQPQSSTTYTLKVKDSAGNMVSETVTVGVLNVRVPETVPVRKGDAVTIVALLDDEVGQATCVWTDLTTKAVIGETCTLTFAPTFDLDLQLQVKAAGGGLVTKTVTVDVDPPSCTDTAINGAETGKDCGGGWYTRAWLNEIHTRNGGADVAQGVEIAVVLTPNAQTSNPLEGWRLVFFKRDDKGDAVLLKEATLAKTVYAPASPTHNIGLSHLLVPGIAEAVGVALVDEKGYYVDFVSWDGALKVTTDDQLIVLATEIGVSEPPASPRGFSLQLSGSGNKPSDFSWGIGLSSFGSRNYGQRFFPHCAPCGDGAICAITADCGPGLSCDGSLCISD